MTTPDPEARFEDVARFSPLVWPGKELAVQPGDMDAMLPLGMGMSGPPIIRPWDDPVKVVSTWTDYYGFQRRTGSPWQDAPMTEPSGGVVYFDDTIEEPAFRSLLATIGASNTSKRYAAFIHDSEHPMEDRYVTQLKIVNTSALAELYQAVTREEAAAMPEQPLGISDLCWMFIERERSRIGASYSSELRGTFGGDGDWAKESLCFGFLVENRWWDAFRIWTRAWLVTK